MKPAELSSGFPSVWGLFKEQPSAERYEALRIYAQQAARAFEFHFNSSLTNIDTDLTRFGKNRELDEWVESKAGRATLLRLTQDLQSRIRRNADAALPAHDIRQILFKDASEGLRFAEYEQPQGYKSSFLIPMFSHDIGRLLEGHFLPLQIKHDDWIPHGQLSFLLMREVLEEYPEIPQGLKNHFLYAVLAHSGENAKTYIGRAVQTCDRMQLIGPEGFLRAVSYCVGLLGGQIAYPCTYRYQMSPPSLEQHESAIAVLEHFGRNGYPNIGDDHYAWQKHMNDLNTVILLAMAEASPKLGQYLFAPENNAVPQSSIGVFKINRLDTLTASEMLRDLNLPSAGTVSRQELAEWFIREIQDPLGSAPLPDYSKANIHAAIKYPERDELDYITAGLTVALKLKADLDQQDFELARQVYARGTDPVAKSLAMEIAMFGERQGQFILAPDSPKVRYT